MDKHYICPSNICYLWPTTKMKNEEGNPTDKRYNDWGMGWFETRSDCVIDQYHAAKADTHREIGRTYRNKIIKGNFGAYCIANDPTYPCCVVEWIGEPWKAEEMKKLKLMQRSL